MKFGLSLLIYSARSFGDNIAQVTVSKTVRFHNLSPWTCSARRCHSLRTWCRRLLWPCCSLIMRFGLSLLTRRARSFSDIITQDMVTQTFRTLNLSPRTCGARRRWPCCGLIMKFGLFMLIHRFTTCFFFLRSIPGFRTFFNQLLGRRRILLLRQFSRLWTKRSFCRLAWVCGCNFKINLFKFGFYCRFR